MNSDQGFIVAICVPFFFAFLVAIYAYFDFSSNIIPSPQIFIATFLVAFYTFVVVFFISMAVFLWRYT